MSLKQALVFSPHFDEFPILASLERDHARGGFAVIEGPHMRRAKTKLVWLAAAGGVAVMVLLVAGKYFDLRGAVARTVAFFRDAGALPFFGAMAVLPALGFPISAFNAVAGPVFGPSMGVGNVIACGALAVTVNLAGCYWIANRALRPLMERWVKRLGYTVPEVPPGAAWEITLVVRIVPGPPLFLQSYLLALARVPFATYMVVSLAVQLAYLATVILAGDAFARGDWRALAFAGVLVVLVGAVMHRLRLRFAAARAARKASAATSA